MSSHLEELRQSYDITKEHADRFRSALEDQLSQLLHQNSLRPATPIESRTKNWDSILVKCSRLDEMWKDMKQIWDYVGLRTVFLFPTDAAQACSLIEKNFDVKFRSNVGQELANNEFGYHSVHFTVCLRPEWMTVPTLRDYLNFPAEIQVRTLSQHNWAVASRLLQYNEPSFAPQSVQRSLFRVAALLEIVDLELERVQAERYAYRNEVLIDEAEQPLNVDLLEVVLSRHFPKSHWIPDDDYSAVIVDLRRCGITEVLKLIDLIDKHLRQALANDQIALKEIRSGNPTYSANPARVEKGVFYSHAGLMLNILDLEFGTDWRKVPVVPNECNNEQ